MRAAIVFDGCSVNSLKPFRMGSQAQALAYLEEYARCIKEKVYDVDSHGDEQAYEARLNKTLTHLKDQVHREENILKTVHSSINEGIEFLI